MLLETFTQRSRILMLHPAYKFGVMAWLGGLAYWNTSVVFGLLLLVAVNVGAILVNGLTARMHLKIVLAVGFSVGFSVLPLVLLAGYEMAWAVGLWMRSLVLFSGLLFLVLSTPMEQIMYVMKRLGMPKVLLEVCGLIYRNIFIMLSFSRSVWLAQQARLGYVNWRVGIRSFANLIGSVLVLSVKRGEDQLNSWEARCYAGEWNYLPTVYQKSKRLTVVFFVVGIAITSCLWWIKKEM